MKRHSFFLVFLLIVTQTVFAQLSRIDSLLFELPDVLFDKVETTANLESIYELKVKQPLDHFDASKGYFFQKVYLTHKGFNNPTVIITEGYNRNQNRIYELTELLNANQLDVEHRFFGESMPDSLNYRYLNLKQASADLHHIRELFDAIYTQKWISTGISKGGSTTIFYRYFYPDDVDVSVPYVAPINNAFEDQRLYDFQHNIGTDDCRKRIRAFQERLLRDREKVLPLLKFYCLGAGSDFTYLTLEEAFEYAVLEYPFSFWQYGHNCKDIPDQNASVENAVMYLNSVSDITFFDDKTMKTYQSHYYQAAQEMGYYGYETKDFEGLLKALPTDSNPHAAFLPKDMKVPFDGSLLKNVNNWLKTQNLKFIYINGALDTWSATSVPPSNKSNSMWFNLKDKHHGTARIREMIPSEKEELITTLERWLSIKIEYAKMNTN